MFGKSKRIRALEKRLQSFAHSEDIRFSGLTADIKRLRADVKQLTCDHPADKQVWDYVQLWDGSGGWNLRCSERAKTLKFGLREAGKLDAEEEQTLVKLDGIQTRQAALEEAEEAKND